ncbi:MAG: hypothetical protein ABIL09_26030 [Gemmatimonadota bacterium]
MFYKAVDPRTGNMWDTWLCERVGTWYLYYLARCGEQWDNISLATSPDGLHWRERGPILSQGAGVTWMGTGSTWRAPQRADRYQINFSEWKGPRQTIFFAESHDLLRWDRLGDQYEFRQDERWYETQGRWDCIWTLARPDGGLYGYWTATPKPGTGGRFGFGQSEDGVTWQALPPPVVHEVGEGEVGAIERIGDRWYMMFGTGGEMLTLVADRPEGPFVPAALNLRLLSGHTYFSRFFPRPEGLLVNHHAIARDGQVYLGLLKSARVDGDGALRLRWWAGNDRLDVQRVHLDLPPGHLAPGSPVLLDLRLDAAGGALVEGRWDLSCSDGPGRGGLYIECEGPLGAAIFVSADGRAELGAMGPDGAGFQVEKTVDRELDFGSAPTCRLALQHSLLELYLGDCLIECFSLPARATGRLGWVRPTPV